MSNYQNPFIINEFVNSLLIGVRYKGEEIKQFIPAKLLNKELKAIKDDTYRSNHPMGWLAKTVTLCIEEFDGGFESRSYYQKYKKIPDIVQQLTLTDASYVLLYGHVWNFGPVINNVVARCINPSCRAYNTFSINIEEIATSIIKFRNLDLNIDSKILVVLEEPITLPKSQIKFSRDIIVTALEFRLPRIIDALSCEKYYADGESGTFIERLLWSCLTTIYEQDPTLSEAEIESALMSKDNTFIPIDEDIKDRLDYTFIENFTVKNAAALERKFAEISPDIDTSVNKQCKRCSEDILVRVSQNFLFGLDSVILTRS